MKNTIKLIGIIALAVIIGLTAAACNKGGGSGGGGKLSGTYVSDDGEMSYTFSGKKVSANAFGEKAEGTYELKDGMLIITSGGEKADPISYKLTGNTLVFDLGFGIEVVLTKK